MAYTPYQSRISRTERRRKLMEELLGQALQPEQQQMVSGRVVPYSPLQGVSKIAQALIARKGIEGAEAEQAAIEKELEEKRRQEQNQVIKMLLGRKEQQAEPQTGGPLRPAPEGKAPYRDVPPYSPEAQPDTYGGQIAQDAMSGNLLNSNYQAFSPGKEYQPAVEADPTKAALYAATSPYLQGTGVDKVAMAMMKNQTQPRGEYNVIRDVTVDGKTIPVIFNTRTRETFNMDGTPFRGSAPDLGPTSPKYDPGVQRSVAVSKKAGEVEGKERTTAQIDLPKVKSDAEYLRGLVNQSITHPGMSGAVGVWSPGKVASYVPGTDESDFKILHDQIMGKQFMEAYQALKGGGQITEVEGEKATEALSRMSRASSEKAYVEAANDFLRELDRLERIAEQRASGKELEPASSDNGGSETDDDILNQADQILGL